MKIQIENFVITSDPMNITLSETKTTTDGKNPGTEYMVPIGYYGSVEQALDALVRQKIRASSATSVHELLEEVRGIREMIRRVMQGI
ncbi:MAG: DUF5405 family protein [Clostridiales bacterium]|nr:DUF5405 family protein [Clostridiales bacterium]